MDEKENKLETLIKSIRSDSSKEEADLFEKEIVPSIKAGEYFQGFDQDNCEDCKGWDGLDYRCECGNRRVYWSYIEGLWMPEAD
jgi:hypothetical protein